MSESIHYSSEEQDLLRLVRGGEAAEIKESLDYTLDLAVFHSTVDLKPEDKNRLWKVKVLMDVIHKIACRKASRVQIHA